LPLKFGVAGLEKDGDILVEDGPDDADAQEAETEV
jgi:hypothetical protein